MRRIVCILVALMFPSYLFGQYVTDPLPYAAIANPLPDTMDQKPRDSVNMKFSPIRLNQAGYRPQDKKYFYYVGSGASAFTIIDQSGKTVGSGTLTSTGNTASGQLKIRASNNATLVSGGDTRYLMDSPVFSGSISEGIIPELTPGVYRIVVGTTTSHPFVIDERVYSWVRDALLKFYGVNRCGESKSWFHPGCHLLDAVTGGWHDCGDHLKEGATMSYTAAVLGLAAAAFQDRDADVYSANQGITQITDGIPDILYEAKHGADFILRSFDKAGGQVGSMITSMGGFGNAGCGDDHMWWGRPEYQDKMSVARGGPPRCARNEPTTDYLGKYAANLAFVSKRIRPYDAAYADRCLKAAKAIYDYTKVKLDLTNTAAYNGATIVTDDAAFGCLALLWATGERKYLDELCYDKKIGSKASANVKLFQGGWFTATDPLFSHNSTNTDWASSQAHVLWGFFKLVLNDTTFCTGLNLTSPERLALVEKTVYNLAANLSSLGLGNQSIQLPENGFWVPPIIKYERPWFTMHTQMEWVWNRYQAGNITEMYYYYDIASKIQGLELPNTPASANWKADSVKVILVRMLDYMIGVNPWDISMIYGVGEKNFNHPHHRAANPEGKNMPGAFYKYCPPVGALQGGFKPIAASVYTEHFDDWMHSETGIDGTTNMLMPVVGLAKEDIIGPPSGTVKTLYVGCDKAIIEVRQTRYGKATIHYGTGNGTQKTVASDSSGVLHNFTLMGLTSGTAYNYYVVVTDAFGRDSTIKYLDQDKMLVNFTFTTLKDCPKNASISNVKVCKVTYDSAEIFWYTPNGEFDSKVTYGEQRPPTTVKDGDASGHPVKFHYVKIGNLKEKTKYYFYVESGDSRDDNGGDYYTFTTPVMHVNFDVRAVRYVWEGMPTIGLNIMNQDIKSYDSLELRLYVRGPETYTLTKAKFGIPNDTVVRFEDHVMFRLDIGIKYRSDGFQDLHFKTGVDKYIQSARPKRMEDTYDAATNTWGYYIPVPMGDAVMESGARFRMDISMLARSPWPPNQDAWNTASLKTITNADWSFGPHRLADGDPYEFAGVQESTKESVDSDNFETPIDNYITVYRKNEYVWGYSPSQAELKTKKTQYSMTSQVTSPLVNPTSDYVFYARTTRSVDVSGWFKIEPIDGELNDIWVNGVEQKNISSLYKWSQADQRYNFTIPVPVQNGKNNIDLTLFAGASATCEECYGCAASNHSFYVEFQGAKQYPSTISLKSESMQSLPNDTAKIDTTIFHVIVTDRNGNSHGKSKDSLYVSIKNPSQDDSISVLLIETADSTGVFQTTLPVSVIDKYKYQSGPSKIAIDGGDKILITYIDPTDPTDISEATLVSKADFPLADDGALFDTNGDGKIDRMIVHYNVPLKNRPDSISFGFPAQTDNWVLRSSVDAFTINTNTLDITFNNTQTNPVTAFSTGTKSTAKSYLTFQNSVKTTAFTVYDSVGPIIAAPVMVYEKTSPGDDTLAISFSEAIDMGTKNDSELMVKHDGKIYGISLVGIIGSDQSTHSMTIIVKNNGFTLQENDSIYINHDGSLVDIAKNHVHKDNRKVPFVLKAAVPKAKSAFYTDNNADGMIDYVEITFSKNVNIGDIAFGLKWNNGSRVIAPNSSVAYVGSDSTKVSVRIKGLLTGTTIVTNGEMVLLAIHSSFPKDTITCSVNDHAAPVIVSAQFAPSGQADGAIIDTLTVTFSEPVNNVISEQPFSFYSVSNKSSYSMKMANSFKGEPSKKIFYVSSYSGIDFPGLEDSIKIDIRTKVTDLGGNTQENADNRFAVMKANQVPFTVITTQGPNPFTIDQSEISADADLPNELSNKKGTLIILTPVSRIKRTITIRGSIDLFDGMGHKVFSKEFIPGNQSSKIYFFWDGHNTRGRLVGAGTYIGLITIRDEIDRVIKEKVRIGVKR